MLSATWLWLSCTRGYARFAGIAAPRLHALCNDFPSLKSRGALHTCGVVLERGVCHTKLNEFSISRVQPTQQFIHHHHILSLPFAYHTACLPSVTLADASSTFIIPVSQERTNHIKVSQCCALLHGIRHCAILLLHASAEARHSGECKCCNSLLTALLASTHTDRAQLLS